jgi:mono/diheme cytochrome c family protein
LFLCALLASGAPIDVAHAESAAAEVTAVFRARCARCHGEDGRSDTSLDRVLKVRPIVGDAALARLTRAEIVKAVRTNEKHAGVIDLAGDDLQKAALVVMRLAATPARDVGANSPGK